MKKQLRALGLVFILGCVLMILMPGLSFSQGAKQATQSTTMNQSQQPTKLPLTPENLLSLIGLLVGIIGGVLGAFSIIVTWKLYQAGNRINIEAMKILSQVQTSSHTAEITSTHYTDRLVGALVDHLNRDMQSSLAAGRAMVTEHVDAALDAELRKIDKDIASRIREKVHHELSSTFRAIQVQSSSLSKFSDSESIKDHIAAQSKALVAPGVPRVVRWIVENESKFRFFSVKFLREKVFKSDPASQEALQFAIDQGILITYELENPVNPSRPTTACKLDRDNPLVSEILAGRDEKK